MRYVGPSRPVFAEQQVRSAHQLAAHCGKVLEYVWQIGFLEQFSDAIFPDLTPEGATEIEQRL